MFEQLHIRGAESQRQIRWKRRCNAEPFRHINDRVDAYLFRKFYGGALARARRRAPPADGSLQFFFLLFLLVWFAAPRCPSVRGEQPPPHAPPPSPAPPPTQNPYQLA